MAPQARMKNRFLPSSHDQGTYYFHRHGNNQKRFLPPFLRSTTIGIRRSIGFRQASVLSLLCILFEASAACGLLPELGYRPDYPAKFETIQQCGQPSDACTEFYNIVKWGEELEKAYRVRANMNEWAFYIAGVVGVISVAVVGGLTATDQGNTDSAKIIPLAGAAIASLFALNQNDDKAAAYSEAVIAIEEAQAAAGRHVNRNISQEGFRAGCEVLTESIRQQIVNLEKRMAAIRKKVSAAIPTTTAMTLHSFTQGSSPNVTIFTAHIEDDLSKVRVVTAPETSVRDIVVTKDRVEFTLENPVCRDVMVMLSIGNTLVLPPRNLRCEMTNSP